MKTRAIAFLLCAALAPWAGAQQPSGAYETAAVGAGAPAPEISVPAATGEEVAPPPTAEEAQIEVLLAPIALYPDALVALILPAASRPSDIVLAARFLSAGGKDEEIDGQSWDESVKGLARFPEVVEFMDANLEWTQDVGDMFVAHPAEVMNAIQALRGRAIRNGALANTPQQQVVIEEEAVRIVPAEPEVIYVPHYEPSILYHQYSHGYYPSSLVWFGAGYGIGAFLSFDIHWGRHSVFHHGHGFNHSGHGHNFRSRYSHGSPFHVGGAYWRNWTPSSSHRSFRRSGDFNFSRASFGFASSRFNGERGRTGAVNGRTFATNTPNSRSLGGGNTFRNSPAPASSRNTAARSTEVRGSQRTPAQSARFSGPSTGRTGNRSFRETSPSVRERGNTPRLSGGAPVSSIQPSLTLPAARQRQGAPRLSGGPTVGSQQRPSRSVGGTRAPASRNLGGARGSSRPSGSRAPTVASSGGGGSQRSGSFSRGQGSGSRGDNAGSRGRSHRN